MISKETKILFVCSYNMVRSVSGEATFRSLGFRNVKSCGTLITNMDDRDSHETRAMASGLVPRVIQGLRQDLVDWAEVIVLMESHHLDWLLEKRQFGKKDIRVLGIPDDFNHWSDVTLVAKMRKLAEGMLQEKDETETDKEIWNKALKNTST